MIDIPSETVDANGLEFDHEKNEYIITKRMYMHIPSHAKMNMNPLNNGIITFRFDNIHLILYPNADPRIVIIYYHTKRED